MKFSRLLQLPLVIVHTSVLCAGSKQQLRPNSADKLSLLSDSYTCPSRFEPLADNQTGLSHFIVSNTNTSQLRQIQNAELRRWSSVKHGE